MSEIRQIVYVSTAMPKLTDAALDDLLEEARLRNADLDVTGLLIYIDGNIMQLIEGPPEAVGDLYRRISADARHSNVVTLRDAVAEERSFPDWRMAAAHAPSLLGPEAEIADIVSDIDLQQAAGNKSAVGALLSGFIRRSLEYHF